VSGEVTTIDRGAEPLRIIKHERVATFLAHGFPQLEAARHGGYPDISPENARRLAQRPEVRERVLFLRRGEKAIREEMRRIAAERLMLWHECDIADFYEDVEEPIFDAEGLPVCGADGRVMTRWAQRLKPFGKIPRDLRMCIDSLTYTERGRPNLKLISKLDANRDIRKMNGLDIQRDVNESDEFRTKSDGEVFAELARQAAELGIEIGVTFNGAGN
jgi:hypothetical protein